MTMEESDEDIAERLDIALTKLGKWGRWQTTTFIFMAISFAIPSTWQLFVIVFIGE